MHTTTTITYPLTNPHDVLAMMRDETFQRLRVEGTPIDLVSFQVENDSACGDSITSIILVWKVDVERVRQDPRAASLARFIRSSSPITIRLVEKWNADGTAATTSITIADFDVSAEISSTLRAVDGSVRRGAEVSLRCRIPLVGAMVERHAMPHVVDVVRRDEEAAVRWCSR